LGLRYHVDIWSQGVSIAIIKIRLKRIGFYKLTECHMLKPKYTRFLIISAIVNKVNTEFFSGACVTFENF